MGLHRIARVVVVAAMVLLPAVLGAQSGSSAITGLVTDSNFNLPGCTLGAPDFGVISSARPARTIQLGARFAF